MPIIVKMSVLTGTAITDLHALTDPLLVNKLLIKLYHFEYILYRDSMYFKGVVVQSPPPPVTSWIVYAAHLKRTCTALVSFAELKWEEKWPFPDFTAASKFVASPSPSEKESFLTPRTRSFGSFHFHLFMILLLRAACRQSGLRSLLLSDLDEGTIDVLEGMLKRISDFTQCPQHSPLKKPHLEDDVGDNELLLESVENALKRLELNASIVGNRIAELEREVGEKNSQIRFLHAKLSYSGDSISLNDIALNDRAKPVESADRCVGTVDEPGQRQHGPMQTLPVVKDAVIECLVKPASMDTCGKEVAVECSPACQDAQAEFTVHVALTL